MGYSTQSIPFFDEKITIRPHSATQAKWLNKKVSIAQFSKGKNRVRLEQVQETGEYIVFAGQVSDSCYNKDWEFMQGPGV